jgi:hypothetical protein
MGSKPKGMTSAREVSGHGRRRRGLASNEGSLAGFPTKNANEDVDDTEEADEVESTEGVEQIDVEEGEDELL